MQNTIKYLAIIGIMFFFSIPSSLAQSTRLTKEPKLVEANGAFEAVGLLGESLWFELRKRLNLVSEKELKAKEEEVYQIKVGRIVLGHSEKQKNQKKLR